MASTTAAADANAKRSISRPPSGCAQRAISGKAETVSVRTCDRARKLRRRFRILEVGFHRPAELDCQRIALAVLGGSGRDPNPTLTDAVFFDVGLLDALEADANVAREHL